MFFHAVKSNMQVVVTTYYFITSLAVDWKKGLWIDEVLGLDFVNGQSQLFMWVVGMMDGNQAFTSKQERSSCFTKLS